MQGGGTGGGRGAGADRGGSHGAGTPRESGPRGHVPKGSHQGVRGSCYKSSFLHILLLRALSLPSPRRRGNRTSDSFIEERSPMLQKYGTGFGGGTGLNKYPPRIPLCSHSFSQHLCSAWEAPGPPFRSWSNKQVQGGAFLPGKVTQVCP